MTSDNPNLGIGWDDLLGSAEYQLTEMYRMHLYVRRRSHSSQELDNFLASDPVAALRLPFWALDRFAEREEQRRPDEHELAAVRVLRTQLDVFYFGFGRFQRLQQQQIEFTGRYGYFDESQGLHGAKSRHDVELLHGQGAPVDGVRVINYADSMTHGETPLLTALYDGRRDAAVTLLERGANPDATNFTQMDQWQGFYFTALHMIARKADVDGTALLIDSGADVNRRTTLGTTPLHLAAEKNQLDVVKFLLDAGADPHLREFDDYGGWGRSPLDSAPWLSDYVLGPD